MPYIDTNGREFIDPKMKTLIDMLKTDPGISVGDVNYIITNIVKAFIKCHGLRYEHINSMIGVLECAKLELYRRLATPYEDLKITQNGDVYDD